MALRGHPSIPATTRDRIVAAAGRIGYQRDAVFSALSNRRSRTGANGFNPRIAFVTNRSPENGLNERGAHRALIDGARRQAEALGYRFEVLFVDEGHHDSASLYRYLKENGINGVIIGAFEPGRRSLEMDWSEFCTVKVDSRHMEPDVTYVSTDQLNAVRTSMQRMRELGYRRVGLAVSLHDEEGTDYMHVSGLLMEEPTFGTKQWIQPLLFPHGATSEDIVPEMKNWIKKNRLDAVLCNWTNIRDMIERAGYRVPDEVACACLCLSRKNPRLAGIVSNMGLVGERVASLLATLLRTERRGIPERATDSYVQGKWYDGASAPLRK